LTKKSSLTVKPVSCYLQPLFPRNSFLYVCVSRKSSFSRDWGDLTACQRFGRHPSILGKQATQHTSTVRTKDNNSWNDFSPHWEARFHLTSLYFLAEIVSFLCQISFLVKRNYICKYFSLYCSLKKNTILQLPLNYRAEINGYLWHTKSLRTPTLSRVRRLFKILNHSKLPVGRKKNLIVKNFV